MTEQQYELPGLALTPTGRIKKPKATRPPKESDEQTILFKYLWGVKRLSLCYSTQNGVKIGGDRKFGIIAQMKKTGLKKGIPDICIPYARGGFHGLYIEMKRQKGGVISDDQHQIAECLRAEGYKSVFCKGFEDAKKVVDDYFLKQPSEMPF